MIAPAKLISRDDLVFLVRPLRNQKISDTLPGIVRQLQSTEYTFLQYWAPRRDGQQAHLFLEVGAGIAKAKMYAHSNPLAPPQRPVLRLRNQASGFSTYQHSNFPVVFHVRLPIPPSHAARASLSRGIPAAVSGHGVRSPIY